MRLKQTVSPLSVLFIAIQKLGKLEKAFSGPKSENRTNSKIALIHTTQVCTDITSVLWWVIVRA